MPDFTVAGLLDLYFTQNPAVCCCNISLDRDIAR